MHLSYRSNRIRGVHEPQYYLVVELQYLSTFAWAHFEFPISVRFPRSAPLPVRHVLVRYPDAHTDDRCIRLLWMRSFKPIFPLSHEIQWPTNWCGHLQYSHSTSQPNPLRFQVFYFINLSLNRPLQSGLPFVHVMCSLFQPFCVDVLVPVN